MPKPHPGAPDKDLLIEDVLEAARRWHEDIDDDLETLQALLRNVIDNQYLKASLESDTASPRRAPKPKKIIDRADSKKYTASALFKGETVDSIKKLGNFQHILIFFEKETGAQVKVRDWKNLFKTLNTLKETEAHHESQLRAIVQSTSSAEAKRKIKERFNLWVKGETTQELLYSTMLVTEFVRLWGSSDPKVRYEGLKRKNFIDSSRLESIEMDNPAPSESLEELIKRHQVVPNG